MCDGVFAFDQRALNVIDEPLRFRFHLILLRVIVWGLSDGQAGLPENFPPLDGVLTLAQQHRTASKCASL
jgi:hypothetical protein